nr:restriction endonuclease subunit S [Rubritalea profundi]
MAQALFKSWFVDFDPVIDNALRAGNPIPAPLQQRAETRRKALGERSSSCVTTSKDGAGAPSLPDPHSHLFPATFTHSEDLGLIPEGWVVVELADLATVKGGKRLPKGSTLTDETTNHPYLRTKDITGTEIDIKNLLYVPDEVFSSISRYIVEKDDVVISIVGTIGLCCQITEELHLASLTENCAKITSIDTSKISQNYLFSFLISSEVKGEVQRRTVGSTQPKFHYII